MLRRGLLSLALVAPGLARAQTAAWPSRPIRVISPFPPGGGGDTSGRIICARLPALLGQPVIVENRTGAGGLIGIKAVGQSPPDGTTFMYNGTANVIKDGYDMRVDVEHILRTVATRMVLVVRSDLPVRSVPDFIAHLKAHPGKVNHGSPGPMTIHHLAAAMLDLEAGTQMENVHYRGTGPAVAGLLGGEVQAMIASVGAMDPLIREGAVRPLATVSATRTVMYPDLPTMAGFLPGYAAELTFSLSAPLGLPEAIKSRIIATMSKVIMEPECRATLERNGFEPALLAGQELAAAIDADIRRWADVEKRGRLTMQ